MVVNNFNIQEVIDNFKQGDYIYISWNEGTKRTISKLDKFLIQGKDVYNYPTGYHTFLSAKILFGINAVNNVMFGELFGVSNNNIRLATKEEIQFLHRQIKLNKLKNESK